MEEFKSVRDHFIQELLTFSASELIKTSLHPRLQKQMRIVDMAFFVAEHDDQSDLIILLVSLCIQKLLQVLHNIPCHIFL